MKKSVLPILFLVFPFAAGYLFELLLRSGQLYSPYYSIEEGGTPFLRIVTLGVGMIAGIISGRFSQELLLTTKGSINPLEMLRIVLRRPMTWLALMASPITFFVIYVEAQHVPDDNLALLLAFQNGFFVDSLFEVARKVSKR